MEIGDHWRRAAACRSSGFSRGGNAEILGMSCIGSENEPRMQDAQTELVRGLHHLTIDASDFLHEKVLPNERPNCN